MATGSNLGLFIYDNDKFRGMERTFPSTYFLLPSAPTYDSSVVFAEIAGQKITVNDYVQLFQMLNFTYGKEHWEDNKDIVSKLAHPGVNVSCLHGADVNTTEKIFYPSMADFPDHPHLISGVGDGTVNQRSLEACKSWQGPEYQFDHVAFPGMSHVDTAKSDKVFQYIINKLGQAAAA